MADNAFLAEVNKRRTFAIISHPDAGKTTITEKLLLFGQAIQQAGSVKGRKGDKMATSDWMAMEQQRGISVTSSVMQFPYADRTVNLLDTPGHEDFSEDTYRTLTAVDSVLMVIDGAKGVEDRTIKLMEVCRLRDTPIFTFVNKMDREVRDQIEVLDEVEDVLKIACAPVTWPIDMGKQFKGVYEKSIRRRGVTGEIMLQILETRLDSVVYSLGFGYTRAQSRQMVTHGHVLVNGRRACTPSIALQEGDTVEIKTVEKSRHLADKNLEYSTSRIVPEWLTLDKAGYKGTVTRMPTRDDIEPVANEQTIVEFYSR